MKQNNDLYTDCNFSVVEIPKTPIKTVEVGYLENDNLTLPKYMTEEAAGMDLYCNLETDLVLKPLARAAVSTGLYLDIPVGFEVQIRPRSGLAIKHGITVINTPGTIDSDYTGEIKVLLINLSDETYTCKRNERIGQLVIKEALKIKLIKKTELKKTKRGANGFGHTNNTEEK